MRPAAVKFFDHEPIIDLILFGYYEKLRNMVLDEVGHDLPGKMLQISCCYGNLTPRLAKRVATAGGMLDVVDVLDVQLENVRRKLPAEAPVRLMQMDSTALALPDKSYDDVLIYFLLHEQPQEVRERTVREALRVLKPSGRIVIADYGKPSHFHPLRYLVLPILGKIEPFAVPLWNHELADILPNEMRKRAWHETSYFGGLYQMLVSTG